MAITLNVLRAANSRSLDLSLPRKRGSARRSG